MDEKAPKQSNNIIVSKLNLNTALKVQRIIDDLINTLDFRQSEIAGSDILSCIVSVGFLKVKLKVNKKSVDPRPGFNAYLFAFRWIPTSKI